MAAVTAMAAVMASTRVRTRPRQAKAVCRSQASTTDERVYVAALYERGIVEVFGRCDNNQQLLPLLPFCFAVASVYSRWSVAVLPYCPPPLVCVFMCSFVCMGVLHCHRRSRARTTTAVWTRTQWLLLPPPPSRLPSPTPASPAPSPLVVADRPQRRRVVYQ